MATPSAPTIEALAAIIDAHGWYEATNRCICRERPVDMTLHIGAAIHTHIQAALADAVAAAVTTALAPIAALHQPIPSRIAQFTPENGYSVIDGHVCSTCRTDEHATIWPCDHATLLADHAAAIAAHEHATIWPCDHATLLADHAAAIAAHEHAIRKATWLEGATGGYSQPSDLDAAARNNPYGDAMPTSDKA